MRARLLAAGARPGFRGIMVDRRYDREGTLTARDEVLRLRIYQHPDGREEARLGWKGPTGVTPEGYKSREELEYEIRGARAEPPALLEMLGFRETYRIERYVEYYRLGTADVRLEWYPRMDVLIEVEGDAAGIESALAVIGLPREGYTPEPLVAFAARYAGRMGEPAILTVEALEGHRPSWAFR